LGIAEGSPGKAPPENRYGIFAVVKTVRTLELARTGEWGQDGAPITRRDLAEVAETFAGRPPLTLGHLRKDQKEGPRYGQILSVDLAENGNTLVGRVEFGDAAGAAYAAGEYDGWSVSIPRRGKDGKRYLHHLALLGETPPKIPGLRELDTVSYEYADGDNVETYSFAGTIKEREEARVTEEEAKKLQEKADRLEAENKKLLEEKAEREKADAAAKAAAKEAAAPKAPEAAPAAAAEGGAKPAEDFADRLAQVEGELRKSRAEALMAKVGGKLPEGLRDKARGLAYELAGNDEAFNFSDGGKAASAKGIDLLGDILSQWPVPVKLGSGGFDFGDPGDAKPTDWSKVAKGM
jgi:hypothetical protein